MKIYRKDFDIDDLNMNETIRELICNLLSKNHFIVGNSTTLLVLNLWYKLIKYTLSGNSIKHHLIFGILIKLCEIKDNWNKSVLQNLLNQITRMLNMLKQDW